MINRNGFQACETRCSHDRSCTPDMYWVSLVHMLRKRLGTSMAGQKCSKESSQWLLVLQNSFGQFVVLIIDERPIGGVDL